MQALQRPHPVRRDSGYETGRAERVRWCLPEKLFALELLPFTRMCLGLQGAELSRVSRELQEAPQLKANESGPKTSKNCRVIRQKMKRFHGQWRQYLKRPMTTAIDSVGRDALTRVREGFSHGVDAVRAAGGEHLYKTGNRS